MPKKLLSCYIVILSVMIVAQIFLFVPKNCQASLMDGCNCTKCSPAEAGAVDPATNKPLNDCECKLNDFVSVGIAFANILLGLTGSLALGAFIYGGVVLLISGGSSEQVTKAKSIFIGAVIGLVVVFASWTIIGFIFSSLGITGAWSSSSWFSGK
jgi:hypothetical protein